MKVHWKHKWMAIPYNGATNVIQGIVPIPAEDLVFHVCAISEVKPEKEGSVHPDIEVFLHDFVVVFQPLSSLPPKRNCYHEIPLLPSARPVHIRPYRYAPALKDEIERQVAEMLSKGVILPSLSAFSSPVLLVKKKDGLWRFSVDYRYSNALTAKSRFPMSVFDELMDELAQAKWFSSLDLNSGDHKVRLKEGEEFKTVFQTHFGHFEF